MENVINKRHSCRFFSERPVSEQDILDILSAGAKAPSVRNTQPWRFRVIKEQEVIDAMGACLKKSKWIKKAPLLIMVLAIEDKDIDISKKMLSIGACIENMLLCATGKGIASCWVSEFLGDSDEVHTLLNIPSSYREVAVIALGYERGGLTNIQPSKHNIEELLI